MNHSLALEEVLVELIKIFALDFYGTFFHFYYKISKTHQFPINLNLRPHMAQKQFKGAIITTPPVTAGPKY